jgi:hypothetical protein
MVILISWVSWKRVHRTTIWTQSPSRRQTHMLTDLRNHSYPHININIDTLKHLHFVRIHKHPQTNIWNSKRKHPHTLTYSTICKHIHTHTHTHTHTHMYTHTHTHTNTHTHTHTSANTHRHTITQRICLRPTRRVNKCSWTSSVRSSLLSEKLCCLMQIVGHRRVGIPKKWRELDLFDLLVEQRVKITLSLILIENTLNYLHCTSTNKT